MVIRKTVHCPIVHKNFVFHIVWFISRFSMMLPKLNVCAYLCVYFHLVFNSQRRRRGSQNSGQLPEIIMNSKLQYHKIYTVRCIQMVYCFDVSLNFIIQIVILWVNCLICQTFHCNMMQCCYTEKFQIVYNLNTKFSGPFQVIAWSHVYFPSN